MTTEIGMQATSGKRYSIDSQPVVRQELLLRRACAWRSRALGTAFSVSLFFAVTPAPAQDELQDTLYAAGTTYRQAPTREWAYVLWQVTGPGPSLSGPVAVYAKQGGAVAPNAYARKAVVVVQTDPAAIKVLLQRATNLGEDLVVLDDRLRNLFQHLVPAETIPVEQKLALAIQGSLGDADSFDSLIMLAGLSKESASPSEP